ncbi:MAG: esterase-like activity of phytase family protein [Sphingobium sp.]
MERIALILLVFILLMNGRHPQNVPPPPAGRIMVHAQPIPLDPADPSRTMLGELRYLAGWVLTSPHREFGGISSLSVDDGGMVTALNDGSGVAIFPARSGDVQGYFRLLPRLKSATGRYPFRLDTESMAHDPATGQRWVGIESDNMICRYSRGFGRAERCARSAAQARWPSRTGMESLARLMDGRFLAIAEEAPGPQGRGHDVLLFAGDPAGAATPPPLRLSYVAPQGYRPTDAVAISGDTLLVLNRRLTLADMFTGVLMLVDIGDLHAGAVLRGREVARLAAPAPHDNFEGLAMSREGGRPILWVASDDNNLFFQRSLLLKFAMPDTWFRDAREDRHRP